jgi:phosphoglycerate kinase
MASELKEGEVLLLENLRFHAAEDNPSLDPNFAKQLASLGEVYVNDAFGTAHRSHSSTTTITHYFPNASVCGLLIQKELSFLSKLLTSPKRPFFAVVGGGKVSSKIGVFQALLQQVDALFIGGGMAFTFLKAQGIQVGESLIEEDQVAVAAELLAAYQAKKIPIWLPRDVVAADSVSEDAKCQFASLSKEKGIPSGFQGVDIGPNTILHWRSELQKAATVFWNGPLGICEITHFTTGTRKIAEALSRLNALTIVGGGDLIAAITQMHLEKAFSHVSTGGGACLKLLELGHLPAIDALTDSKTY